MWLHRWVRWVFIFHTILVLHFPSSNNTRPGKSQAWYKMKEVFKFSFNVSSDDEDASEAEEYAFPNSFAYMHRHASNMHNEFLFWVSSSYCSSSFLTMHCIEALCVCCWEWLILLQMHIHSHDLMQWALIFGSVILLFVLKYVSDYSPFYHWPSFQFNLFAAT